MRENAEKPKVSIIIPTYNSGKTLEDCFKSIKDQTYPSIETIVVDNFSDDNTLAIARRFKVKAVQRRCNSASARNIGVADSTGRYVLFLDSDQVLSPIVVEECVEKCLTEQAGMVRIPELFVGEGFWDSCSAVWKNYLQKVEQMHGASGNTLSGEPRFFLKERILQVGMLDAELVWGEDLALYEKLKKVNVKEASCKSCISHYELTSIKALLTKNLRYGRHIPAFMRTTKKQLFPSMVRHAFLTSKEVFKDFGDSPATIVGCLILLSLKTYSIVVTLPLGLLMPVNEG